MSSSKKTCPAEGWTFKCNEEIAEGEEFCYWHTHNMKTRKDVQRAMELAENNPRILEGAHFRRAELSGESFRGIKLVEADFGKALLSGCDFSGADLWRARFDGADLTGAVFENAQLAEADFSDANLRSATLECSRMRATRFIRSNLQIALLKDAYFENTVFEDAIWDERMINAYEKKGELLTARKIYQNLKSSHLKTGDAARAGEFFYREKECERKGSACNSRRLTLSLLWLFWGYGERPFRTIFVGMLSILVFAVIYYLIGGLPSQAFWEYLYFSAVSFTALGYGNWVVSPGTLTRVVAIGESFFGVVIIASFIAALARKMTRT